MCKNIGLTFEIFRCPVIRRRTSSVNEMGTAVCINNEDSLPQIQAITLNDNE